MGSRSSSPSNDGVQNEVSTSMGSRSSSPSNDGVQKEVSTSMGSRSSSPSNDGVQNEVRYKLIIDPSEDESITRLLFMFGILRRKNTRTYMCSDFSGDGQLQKVSYAFEIYFMCISYIIYLLDKYHSSY